MPPNQQASLFMPQRAAVSFRVLRDIEAALLNYIRDIDFVPAVQVNGSPGDFFVFQHHRWNVGKTNSSAVSRSSFAFTQTLSN